ncbi:MAG TPA: glutamate--tRNA ligase family protein, partial [Candidatus Babeliales bacterium]|nr:glutamate--tRNA ligase family protein [Candidatus Babeliales bacterium]
MSTQSNSVRVRFAPSPTGHLHIGGLRTALFNWLFARHNNGTYLLRIEDTDLERSKQEYTDVILEAFNWTNIKPDEPIVIQSERYPEHAAIIEQLIREGKAYRC